MAHVFVSHSSRDNAEAAEIKAWLDGQGFAPAFLDIDKHSGIPPGADWERTLYEQIQACQALLLLQTPHWSASRWCFAEFTQARALGKPVFQVVVDDAGAAEVPIASDLQRLDLRHDREAALAQLNRALSEIALQDQGGFAWPPPNDRNRPPFPGLMVFEEDDAAVFFGRDGDWRAVIERLRSRRAQGGPRLLVLQGASGSGKSSLLRAGVLPRLRRAGDQWLVLPPLRPEARPLQALAVTLAQALAQGATPAASTPDWRSVHQRLLEAAPSSAAEGDGSALRQLLSDWITDLRQNHQLSEAQVLLSIDQAEELFTVAEPNERQTFLAVLGAALASGAGLAPLPLQAVMTIRSDAMGSLQAERCLQNRFETLPLGPLSPERWREIIEGPARVAGLKAEPAFVARAIADTATEDALPLLAFALRLLHDNYGADGVLSLADYEALGDKAAGLSPLDNAVRQAADEVMQTLRPSEADTKALRQAFVPAMVRVSEQGSYTRRAARWDALPAAAKPLLEALQAKRLLVRRQKEGEPSTLEVAHEALLRVWPRLKSWLDEDREFLIGSQQLEQDLQTWQKAHEADRPSALLTGLKLQRAKAWLAERPEQLAEEVRGFVQSSIDQAEARERQARRTRRGVLAGLSLLTTLAVTGGAIAFWQLQRSRAAQAAQYEATHRALISSDPFMSVVYGLAAMRYLQPSSAKAIMLSDSLGKAIQNNHELNEISTNQAAITAMALLPSGDLVTAGDKGFINWWNNDGKLIRSVDTQQLRTSNLIALSNGNLASAGDDGSIKQWSRTGKLVSTSENYSRTIKPVFSLAELASGKIASGCWDGFIRIWGKDGRLLHEIQGVDQSDPVYSLLALKNGELISGTQSGKINHWSEDGRLIKSVNSGQGEIHALAALPNGEILSGGAPHMERHGSLIKRWDRMLNLINSFESGQGGVRVLAISSDDKIISGGGDGSISSWNLDGANISRITSGQGRIAAIISLPKQKVISGGFRHGSVKVWSIRPRDIPNNIPARHRAVSALTVDSKGKILTGGDDGYLYRLNRENKLTRRITIWPGEVSSIVAMSDNSVIASIDGLVKHFDENGTLINSIKTGQESSLAIGRLGDDEIVSAGIHHKEPGLFGEIYGSIVRTDLNGRRSAINTGPGALTALTVLPNGEMAVSKGGLVQIWNKDGKMLKSLNTGADHISSLVALSSREIAVAESRGASDPDNQKHLTPEEGVVSMWNINGNLIGKISTNQILHALAITPNGDLLAGGSSSSIKIWAPDKIAKSGCLQLQQHLALRYPQTPKENAASKTCKRLGFSFGEQKGMSYFTQS